MGLFRAGLEPRTDEFGYYYLGVYHPFRIHNNKGGKRLVRNPKFDLFSRMVLNLKSGYFSGIEHFETRIELILNPECELSIAVVPAHDGRPETGIMKVAASLCLSSNRIDAKNCLSRFAELPKLASGGTRGVERHLKTIRVCTPENIAEKTVLLIDDVSTTGASFSACEQLLLEAGALNVTCLAMGKTAFDNL